MTPKQIALIQMSFAKVVPIADAATTMFYARLFEIAPDTRPLFPEDLTELKKKLVLMLESIVTGLTQLDRLIPSVHELGERHAAYRVNVEHFMPVGTALLWTLQQGLGEEFTPEVEDAWSTAYDLLAQTMIDGMMQKVSQAA
ncbi:MAG TPA: globin family protein [Reyranella sp.]|nr:globin family protein [Reyranella sp.]